MLCAVSFVVSSVFVRPWLTHVDRLILSSVSFSVVELGFGHFADSGEIFA